MKAWYLELNEALALSDVKPEKNDVPIATNQERDVAETPVRLPEKDQDLNESDDIEDQQDGEEDEEEIAEDDVVAAVSIGLTRASLDAYFRHYGVVHSFEGNAFNTKTVIVFTCKCGRQHSKKIRDFTSAGPRCRECWKSSNGVRLGNHSKEKTERKSLMQVIKDDSNEKMCTSCQYVKPIQDYVHSRYTHMTTSICLKCRSSSVRRGKVTKKAKKEAFIPDDKKETHKKCSSCFSLK